MILWVSYGPRARRSPPLLEVVEAYSISTLVEFSFGKELPLPPSYVH